MKLGVFDHLQKNDRPELSYQDLYARHLDMVEYLDQAGFEYYFVAENCAYVILRLLDVARPALDLASRFHLVTLPVQPSGKRC